VVYMNGAASGMNEFSLVVSPNFDQLPSLEEQLFSLTVTILHCCSFCSTHTHISRQMLGSLFLLLRLEGHSESSGGLGSSSQIVFIGN
jgi:hypothetical protein